MLRAPKVASKTHPWRPRRVFALRDVMTRYRAHLVHSHVGRELAQGVTGTMKQCCHLAAICETDGNEKKWVGGTKWVLFLD